MLACVAVPVNVVANTLLKDAVDEPNVTVCTVVPSACKPGRTASVASACTRKMFSVVPLNGFALSLIVFPTSLAILPSLSFIIFILRSLESPIAIPTSAKFVSVVNDASRFGLRWTLQFHPTYQHLFVRNLCQ